MTLYSHQQDLLDKNPPRHLISWSTGTGKTIMALALIKKNKVYTLVIVPKALKENWKRVAEQHQLGHMIHIISKEEFRRDWDKLPCFKGIVIDEFHYFGNIKSQLSKALLAYRRKNGPQFIWGLTATPYLSSPMNIYALATHLGHKWNYWDFFSKFFHHVRMGRRLVPVVKKNIGDKLAKLVQEIGSTAKLEDLIDVPAQVYETEYFSLTQGQTRAINKISETNHIVRWTKMHQVENGVLYGDEYSEEKIQFFPCDKTDRIKDLVVANEKVAIFCRYNGQIEYLKDQLKDLGRTIYIINGQVKNRDEVIQEVEAISQAVVLINSSCSEGYELPSVSVIVFASLSFKYSDFIQAQGRFLRINRPKRNLFITLVTEGVDKDVYGSIKKKEDFAIKIFNYDNN